MEGKRNQKLPILPVEKEEGILRQDGKWSHQSRVHVQEGKAVQYLFLPN